MDTWSVVENLSRDKDEWLSFPGPDHVKNTLALDVTWKGRQSFCLDLEMALVSVKYTPAHLIYLSVFQKSKMEEGLLEWAEINQCSWMDSQWIIFILLTLGNFWIETWIQCPTQFRKLFAILRTEGGNNQMIIIFWTLCYREVGTWAPAEGNQLCHQNYRWKIIYVILLYRQTYRSVQAY